MKETGFVSSSSYGDPVIRLTLMQILELQKELEMKRRKLEMIKQKRLTLKAEVRFLSRRYNYLKQDQTLETSPEMLRLSESGDLDVPSKPSGNRKKHFDLRAAVPCFDKKQKDTVCNQEEALANNATCDLEKNLDRSTRNEDLTNSLPDLNGDVNSFDLNMISREEEVPAADGEQMVPEATKNTMLVNGNNLQDERRLPINRNVDKELNGAVKRKVSWQDPVALTFHSPKRTYAPPTSKEM